MGAQWLNCWNPKTIYVERVVWRPSGSGSVRGSVLHGARAVPWRGAGSPPALHRWQGHRHCCFLPSHHGFWLIGAAPGWQQPDLSRPCNSGVAAEVNPSITGTKEANLLSHHHSVLAVSPQGYLISQKNDYTYWVILGKLLPETESLKKLKNLDLGFLYILIQI